MTAKFRVATSVQGSAQQSLSPNPQSPISAAWIYESPIRARTREPESKEESDLLWTPESESKEESDLLWTPESESKEGPDWLWTPESESKEGSDLARQKAFT
jgi:hypothetical protein